MRKPTNRILVVRNDRLGDFMLSYPSFRALKSTLPDYEVWALVPEYTAPMAELCPWVDGVVIDPGQGSGVVGWWSLLRRIYDARCDASIALYSSSRTGLALLLAGISCRVAPASRIAQFFHNRRLKQRRSRSQKPEYEYNLELVRYYLQSEHATSVVPVQPPYLEFGQQCINELRAEFGREYGLDLSRPIVFMHCCSGGSASNLTLAQYRRLAEALHKQARFNLVLTAGPGEIERVRELSSGLQAVDHVVLHSTEGLIRFAQHIACADLFISGSTGPLHIAGALDVPTVAFYPRRRSSTGLRWQTLNSESNRFAFAPRDDADEDDMESIDVDKVAERVIRQWPRLAQP